MGSPRSGQVNILESVFCILYSRESISRIDRENHRILPWSISISSPHRDMHSQGNYYWHGKGTGSKLLRYFFCKAPRFP